VCGSKQIYKTMKNIFSNSRLLSTVGAALLLTVATETIAQSNYFNSSRNWSLNKKEVYFGLSATQFLGDLGGGDGPGRQLSPLDMNFPATRVGFNGGYRYRFSPRFATKTNFNMGMVSGDDAYSGDPGRRQRNLHFRSVIIEVSQQLEYIFWYSENVKSSKKRRGSYFNNSSQAYLFAGVGAFYYNPQAEYQGKWENLRPLGTEGQYMSDGPKPYGMFSASVPLGIGFKTTISPFWRIGFEIAVHKTFTDYIDDVSGTYYHNMSDLEALNPLASALANRVDPSLNFVVDGKRRGNPDDNDAMVYFNVHAIYNLSYKKGPMRAKKGRGMKTKF
jgi:hypothetical protein